MTTITVPATMDGAEARLGELEHVATSAGWERAAIVWAYVTPGNVQLSSAGPPYSINGFAQLGLPGLRRTDSVRHYYSCWQWAIDNAKAMPARPGVPATLPDVPWPPVPAAARLVGNPQLRDALTAQAAVDGVGASKVLDVAANPRAVAAAIKASPALAKAAREAIRERDRLETAADKAAVDQAGERAAAAVGKALGIDPIAHHLRQAAAEIGQAILGLDLYGPGDARQVGEAVAKVERYLAMFKAETPGEPPHWSDDDREFLGAHGVAL